MKTSNILNILIAAMPFIFALNESASYARVNRIKLGQMEKIHLRPSGKLRSPQR
jgi:hypothetical protein